MARTRRAIPYKHYWGNTKAETKREFEASIEGDWRYEYYKRAYLLHGTDTLNWCYPTHEYFNRANRVGRRIERDQLRPQVVMGENFDFDDSRYRRKYKGVWWDIY